MAPPKIEVAPELIAEGKRLYERTLTPLYEIAALMGLKRRTLNNRIVEWNWTRRHYTSGGITAAPAVLDDDAPAAAGGRASAMFWNLAHSPMMQKVLSPVRTSDPPRKPFMPRCPRKSSATSSRGRRGRPRPATCSPGGFMQSPASASKH